MKKFYVEVTTTLVREYLVTAANETEAQEIVEDDNPTASSNTATVGTPRIIEIGGV